MELETTKNSIKNLRGREGLSMVMDYFSRILQFITDTIQNRDTLSEFAGVLTLTQDQVMQLREIGKKAAEIQAFLQNKKFTEADLESMKSDLEKKKTELEQEMVNTQNNLEALLIKDPKSNLMKIHELLDQGIQWGYSRASYRLGPDQASGIINTLISEYMEKPKALIGSLYTQLYELKDRKKEKKQEKPVPISVPAGETQESVEDKLALLKTMNDRTEEKKRRWFK